MSGLGDTTVLPDVLLGAASRAPDQVIVHVRGDGGERTVTFRELRDESLRVAGGLLDAGLAPGTAVLLLTDAGDDFQPLFWGLLAAGLVPVPLAPDVRRIRPVWEFLDRPPVAVDAATAPLLSALGDGVRPLYLDVLRDGRPPAVLPVRAPDDLAFLQFSSGSTGAPKGVELTHAAVLANLEQIRVATAIGPDDVAASWMPYFHDMGLIGTHLVPLAARIKQVKLSPLSFAKRPALWLEAVARHRATLLSAANFALALVERRIPVDTLARLDLTSVRMILVGAEPISPAVWRAFVRRMRPTGLAAQAPQPVYGLAEATLAVTIPPLGEVAEPLVLDRAALGRGRVTYTGPGPHAVELMPVGRPVPGCEVRIVDATGARLGDRRVGHIEVRGAQLARGYHRSPAETGATFRDGWLRTGDLGFLFEGRLCVTGRHKDVVFVNGATYHASDLEEVAAGTPGQARGPVAVVGSADPVSGGERVVVFVTTRRSDTDVLREVAVRVGAALGHDDVRVLALPARAFPRTTSGKLRRALMRERFEAGSYAEFETHRAVAVDRTMPASSEPIQRTEQASSEPVLHTEATSGEPVKRAEQAAGEPVPVRDAGSDGLSVPRSRREVESAVLGIWAQVLGLPVTRIGLDDRFSALGGSSLKAMQVLAAVEDLFGVSLRPSDVRDHDTVAALAGHVLAADDQADIPEHPGGPDGPTIVVTGTACRFPGADTPEEFWRRLAEGHDAVTGVPAERWADPADAEGRWGAFLDDPAAFDAEYFGIGEEEATATDPQARLFLELAHEALERAGYAGPRRRGRRVGVFAAAGESGYRRILEEAELPASALVGNLGNLLAARVAHCLDLTGPALVVDTACSSALVALHLARRSLQQGECDVAVVGGVHLNLTPDGYSALEKTQALSPTGRCHTFGAAADGFVPGEGGAAIVLTRLDDAERAGDPILAVLRGTAVNNDGRSLSLMAPNPLTQREVITQAYREAGIDPGSVSYVEAHGTGTPIGDPIELASLAHAFPPRADGRPRLLGSVKTNLGHLLNSAGMPGLVKVLLVLRHRQLPPSLHHTPLAPKPDLGESGFAVVSELREWDTPGPLVAGINAFGFGGTNAHAILTEPPTRRPASPSASAGPRSSAASGTTDPQPPPASTTAGPRPPHTSASAGLRAAASVGPWLLTLSARSAQGLRAAMADLARHLREHPELDEGDVCAAVAAARDEGPHRLAVVSDGDLAARLEEGPAGRQPGSRPRLVLLLPGQGAQRPGQARALHADAPVFRDVLDEASDLVGEIAGRSLSAWCLDPGVSPADLARTDVAQPLLVAYGVAVARQLRAWGIVPDAVAGHSVGEIAAACVAGRLTLGDAVRFAAERGRLMNDLCVPGAMAAVRAGEDVVAELVAGSEGALSVAAINAPAQTVIAGTPQAVDRAVRELTARGIAARRLEVSRAFHSPLMDPALDPLAEAAASLTLRSSVTPLMSTVTAEWQPALTPEYLREHAARPVRFGAAVERLLDDGYDTFLELGPTPTLGGSVRAIAAAHGRTPVVLASRDGDGVRGLLETAGRLWEHGVSLDRTALDAGRARVAVPTYPFQRRRYWPAAAPRRLLHRFVWDDAPLTVGPEPHTVLLAGPDCPLSRALADRLKGRGATVNRAEDPHADQAPRPDVVVLFGGPATDPDSVAELDAAHLAMVRDLHDLLPRLANDRPRVLVVTEDVHVTGVVTGDVHTSGHTSAVPKDRHATTEHTHPAGAAPKDGRASGTSAEDTHTTEHVDVTGEVVERPRPVQAVLIGLASALPDELPGVVAQCIDLSSSDDLATRLSALDRELASREGTTTVAWRAGRRLGRTPEPAVTTTTEPALTTEPAVTTTATELPADGVYLITGGAGGVGSALARDLADRGRPTLVLIGRSPQPPVELLSDLRSRGAVAQYRVADVSCEADVDAVLADLPHLDGVFHAAGVVRPGTLRAKSPEEVAGNLAAKTRGTHLLARALLRYGLRPVICVAFSSVSSVLPGLAGALGDYVAANAFLDAFAAAERAAGRPWLALNFAAITGTGLAAGLPAGRTGSGLPAGGGTEADQAESMPAGGTGTRPASGWSVGGAGAPGLKPLSAADALRALRDACGVDACGVGTRGVDAAQLLVADLEAGSRPRAVLGAEAPAPVTPHAKVEEASDGPELLRRLVAEALRCAPDDIGDDEPFLGLGLDSLTAVDLVKRLERRLNRSLPITLFFEHRTLRELSAYLQDGPQRDNQDTDDRPFPLTPVQLAFRTQSRLYPDIAAYGYVRQSIDGPLDAELLGRALKRLADRHPMLRLRVRSDDTAVSVPSGDGVVPDWYEVRPGICANGEELAALETALCNRVFDLTTEAPVRALLVRTGTGTGHLVVVVHHAAADGFSLNLLGAELWTVYTALAWGRTPALPSLETTFSAYAAQAQAERSSAAFRDDLAYWRDTLALGGEPLALPYDGDPRGLPGPPLLTHQVATGPELAAALRDLAAAHGVSLFQLLLSAYLRCLSRWSGGRRDVAVNVARARRDIRLPGVERIVGPLADTLPVMARVEPGESVFALAARLRDTWAAGERHGRPTSLDLARLLPANGAGPRTVSPVSFSFARFPVAIDPGCPVEVRPVAAGTASAATRLSLLGWEADGELHFSWNFPSRLFDRATIEELARQHLAELAESTFVPRRTELHAEPRAGVVARLLARFRAAPGAIAVDTGAGTMTYAELDRVSAALAARLRAAGVVPGDLVGLITEPGADTVAGVVGILRAGAGWVPLDAAHPSARLAGQLARTGARTLVCHDATRAPATALAQDVSATLVTVDDRLPEGIADVPRAGPGTGGGLPGDVAKALPAGPETLGVTGATAVDPEAVAYVIFTSGSTGRPKGVPITYQAMENYLDWALATFGYRPGDRLAQTASACFDASVRQLLTPLLAGATVVTLPRHLVRDPEALLERVEQGRITVWSSVPGLWSRLLEAAETRVRNGGSLPDLSALRWIHVGGEALPAAHVRRWYDLFGPGQRIANLYGPTEATINATCHVIDARPADDVRTLPIGRPLTGTRVEVVAPDGRRCAPGEPGELLISGVGLTPGYLGEPELTAAAFTERDGRRWYRSGDRVVRTPAGELEFLGRVDDQVKVRGHRVEPGEIEAALQTHPAVARAAVVPHGDRLAAFVECRAGAPVPEATALRAYLAGMLPAYLVPSRLHVVDALPLTGTGKIDRGDLTPAPVEATPKTPTEVLLARIWSELLDVPSIGREDDFFDLGGDSILILEVFARLREKLPNVPRPTVVYTHGTLKALAAAVDETPGATPVDTPHGKDGPFPLTPSQRGFLLAEAIAPEAPSTWLACVRIHGQLDHDRFQRAADTCVVRHPMLRTVFPAGTRPAVQQELPPAIRLPVAFETLPDPELLPSKVAEERARRFESWAWPLLRLRLITLTPDEHVLIVHGHHLIGDGYSAALLGRELLTAYDRGDAAEPPPLRSTFRDHVALLERTTTPARPTAPYQRPVLGGKGPYRSAGFTLQAHQVTALRRMAREAGTTLFAPILTAYYRTLATVTGQDDLILGLAVTGRDHAPPDAHRVFGPFAAAVPLRPARPPGAGRAFTDDLRRVAAEVVSARTDGLRRGTEPPAQFFFTFLDFSALGPLKGETLSMEWDDLDSDLAPTGTDTFLAARPAGDGELRLVLRASVFTEADFDAFVRALRQELATDPLDAALIGYLPAPGQLTALAGLEPGTWSREQVRALLFPDGRPRLVEEISTPLGRSGFVCLPLFADELPGVPDLAGRAAGAVEYAASLGARCVSLAGMIPSLTGYGYDVLRETTAAVTTGHAATAVSVVKTVHAALERSGRTLDELTVAVAGLGSIGRACLELLLTLAESPPARLLLCDVAGSAPRLAELAKDLVDRGLAGAVEVHEPGPALYEATLLITAISGDDTLLDVDRLRPGTIVVDDSFPHCFDPAKALARMEERRDVLIVGGGLLAVSDVERRIADGLPPAAYAAQSWIPGTIASCRLESLLRAARPGLPLVHGLVGVSPALAYWRAMEEAGVGAGPLHLLGHEVKPPPARPATGRAR